MKKIIVLGLFLIALSASDSSAKNKVSTTGANTIATGVPFLTIAPDSRGGAMGDAGVASIPDINSQHWNPAKYAFLQSDMGVALSYTPWLRNLVQDVNLAYLVGYKRLDDVQTLSASLRYFALGDISFMTDYGDFAGQQSPNEFALDMGYSRLLSDNFSGAVSLRFIRSDLTGGQLINGVESHAGTSFAADVAFYYQNEFRVNRKRSAIAAGLNISNIGGKISYTEGAEKDFIPTNLRLGGRYSTELDRYNKVSFNLDFNKLMVPTPDTTKTEGDIITGLGLDKSVISAMFSSFGDAPGGFKEELQEVTVSLGAEYWYNDQFAIRLGYFNENENKGNRKYITAGAGLKMNVFSLDFSYLLPVERNNPLENTLRFTLAFDMEAFNKQKRRK